MAVAEAHRRRGYGLALLTAAEALVRALGENEIYLHTRWVPGFGLGWRHLDKASVDADCVHSAVWASGMDCKQGAERYWLMSSHESCAPPIPNKGQIPTHHVPPCRVQDKPAQLMYAKAGYEEVAADTFLVKLLGLDQRRLLRKRLQR